MAWIESHQSLGGHKKLRRLVRQLRVSFPQAVGHLHYLWWWALDNAPDGDMSAIENADIADAARWKRDPDSFVQALNDAGFMDNPGKTLHDWGDYTGKLIARRDDRRDQNREAQRRHRANLLTRQHVVSTDHADSKRTTVPNRTQPYPTVPVKKVYKETIKKTYGEFNNVILTDEQHRKLIEKFTEIGTKDRIENLSAGIASKGYKYKSHYATILSWDKMDKKREAQSGAHKGNLRPVRNHDQYTEPYADR